MATPTGTSGCVQKVEFYLDEEQDEYSCGDMNFPQVMVIRPVSQIVQHVQLQRFFFVFTTKENLQLLSSLHVSQGESPVAGEECGFVLDDESWTDGVVVGLYATLDGRQEDTARTTGNVYITQHCRRAGDQDEMSFAEVPGTRSLIASFQVGLCPCKKANLPTLVSQVYVKVMPWFCP